MLWIYVNTKFHSNLFTGAEIVRWTISLQTQYPFLRLVFLRTNLLLGKRMKLKGLWQWCLICNINLLDRIHCLKHGCANHATEGETLQSPIHCCDITKPPYLFSGELCTSSLQCKRLFVYTVCCRRAVSASLCSEHVNQTSYWRSWRQ